MVVRDSHPSVPRESRLNLKTKSSLTVAALLIVVFGIGILVQDYLIRTSLKHTIADQQFALASRVAGEIDSRLAINLDALECVAAGLTPALVADRPALQRFVRDKTGILAIFDALIVVSPSLEVLADVPQVAGRVGTDVSGLAHLVRLRETRQPVVSQPFLGKVTGRPTVAMSVPVREPGGRLIAILSGTFDLYAPNFLGSLNAVREPGVARYVLTTRERATLVGPDPARVLAPYAEPGEDPVYDRAVCSRRCWHCARPCGGCGPIRRRPRDRRPATTRSARWHASSTSCSTS